METSKLKILKKRKLLRRTNSKLKTRKVKLINLEAREAQRSGGKGVTPACRIL